MDLIRTISGGTDAQPTAGDRQPAPKRRVAQAVAKDRIMKAWQEDLLNLLLIPENAAQDIFPRIENAAFSLGFDHVAYGFQTPYPATRPRITLLNNYPRPWQRRYTQAGYLLTDPTVAHGRRDPTPLLWSAQTFADTPALWADVQDHDLRTGWAQSCLDRSGSGGMLTLCRSREPLTACELAAKEVPMRWLVQVAHVSLSRALMAQEARTRTPLTQREREVLQWTADGKSAQDIADILTLSKSAVEFHLKNVVKKLHASNKTAAVVRAALMGLLG